MASITVRNVPDEVHRALRVLAAQHGRSAEAEIRDILERAVKPANAFASATHLPPWAQGRARGRGHRGHRPGAGQIAGKADEVRMIVLDTNVISEAMRPAPNPAVRAWLNEQVAETLYLTSVTLAEMLFGIAVLPAGRRRHALTRALDGLLELFGDRVLPFDTDAARHYTALAVAARNAGRGFPTPDGYIAAIAASRGFIVASRDTSPYEAGGLRVVDPWQS